MCPLVGGAIASRMTLCTERGCEKRMTGGDPRRTQLEVPCSFAPCILTLERQNVGRNDERVAQTHLSMRERPKKPSMRVVAVRSWRRGESCQGGGGFERRNPGRRNHSQCLSPPRMKQPLRGKTESGLYADWEFQLNIPDIKTVVGSVPKTGAGVGRPVGVMKVTCHVRQPDLFLDL
jgi:hypothetical protein